MDTSGKSVKVSQSLLNDSTRGQWAMFASHRQRIEQMLLAARAKERASICVLGAGNCNDLDLHWLSQIFAEVQLVDLDEAALHKAIERQKATSLKLRCAAPIDLTGIAAILDGWTGPGDVTPESVKLAADRARQAEVAELSGQKFDVVLSPCLLSQLLSPARDRVGPSSVPSWPLLAALRQRHLRLMLDLLSPGGTAILLCDLVSSDTVPPLMRAGDDEVLGLMRTLLANGKCFKGLEPAGVITDLAALGASDVRAIPPWLWRLGFHRTYLVYGMQFGGRP